MFLDILINFFVSYKIAGEVNKERDISKIAHRYLKGQFTLDFIMIIPFGLLA